MRGLLPGAEHSRFSFDPYIMKRLSLILLLLFAAWGGLRAQPALTLLQKGYDLGSIPEDGGTVSRVYTFRNSGNAPLVVVRAETSCTCTKADISKKPVMPGQDGYRHLQSPPSARCVQQGDQYLYECARCALYRDAAR